MLTAERVEQLNQIEKGRLDISIYTDREVFDAELQDIFYKTWIYVGHESEIVQQGDYLTTYIGRIPVIVSRDEENRIHVLVNRCAHRGPTVCQQEFGNANFFRCEYHGWVYGNDGSLAGVSLRRGFGPGEIDDIQGGLDRAPRVATYRGLIFASLSADGPTLEEHLGMARKYIDLWADASPTGDVVVGRTGYWKHTYIGNWKLQVEGSNEGYHVGYMHRITGLVADVVARSHGTPGRTRSGAFEGGGNRQLRINDLELGNRGLDLGNGHSICERGASPAGAWKKNFPEEYVEALVSRLGEARAQEVMGQSWRLVIFPNVGIAPAHIRVHRPIEVGLTEIKQCHVSLPDVPASINLARIRAEQSFYGSAGYGSPDDIEMFARMFEGYRSSGMKNLRQTAMFTRQLTTESFGEEGERIGHTTAETIQRSMYRAWKQMMKGESYVSNPWSPPPSPVELNG
jgi:phenylpropionate dioxygenase-like ring-hydroxylating dioxygenase large terminal subunit